LTKGGWLPIITSVPVANVENLLKESRSAIIELLKVKGALTVEQLAQELAVTKVCVRRHLSLLERDGLIEYEQEHLERGRPRFLYRLTDKASCLFPRSYDEFAKEVLTQVRREFGEEAVQRVLQGRADELVTALHQQLAGLGAEERVKKLVKIICEKGYLAEARKLKDGSFRLRQRNCPTEKVATSYPQVCEQELRVYREALGCEVALECRIVDGATLCEFKILPELGKRALPIYTQPATTPHTNLDS
jgi:predicted ArsR family transcriptional regulator